MFPSRISMGCLLLVGFSSVGFGQYEVDGPVNRKSGLARIDHSFELADGPAWDGVGALYVPDVKAEVVYRYTPTRQQRWTEYIPQSGRISATYFSHGTLFMSDNANARIARRVGRDTITVAQNNPQDKPPARPNDLVLDAEGGVYYTLTRQNRVMYVAPDGNQKVAVDGIPSPNGIILAPDGGTLYVSAYRPKQVWQYDVNSPGQLENGRLFARMDAGDELGADGMTMDRAGNVYCAGPEHVWIWGPDGKPVDRIACPSKPINCAFGDQDMHGLYITCRDGLYRQSMNVAGVSPHPAAVQIEGTTPTRPSTAIPANVQANINVVYATHGTRKLLADVFVPTDVTGPKPCLVVVHGGGWQKGDKTKFRALAVELAKHGFVTAAIEYRLAREAAFPAAIQDCNAAVRFLRDQANRFEIDTRRMGAIGGSAGGHLVGLMATGQGLPELQGSGGNPNQSSRISAAIVMAGPMQMMTGSVAEKSREPGSNSNSNIWLRGTVDEVPDRYRLADAHLHISEDDCPVLFMVGEHDQPERNRISREALAKVGVETGLIIYKDGKHGCWNQLPWFDQMVPDMVAFFQKQLK